VLASSSDTNLILDGLGRTSDKTAGRPVSPNRHQPERHPDRDSVGIEMNVIR
jgi:hypothetical protein